MSYKKDVERIKEIINALPEADYRVTVPVFHIEENLARWEEDFKIQGKVLELIPDFQRGHVWNLDQKRSYVENLLRGIAPKEIKFITGSWLRDNWHDEYMGNMYCLDGLQRLTALREFVRGEFKIFNGSLDWSDIVPYYKLRFYVDFSVFVISTREECLRLYLDLNSGGTPHSDNEIKRVKGLLLDSSNEG